jgi:eukaryotic-like serine/threonine-protein kinase
VTAPEDPPTAAPFDDGAAGGPKPRAPSEPFAPDRDDALAEARAAELVGTVVSQRYRIDQLLARGGMGAVYRGHHLHLKKRVAVKVLHPDTDDLPEMLARFEREAIAGAHVVHPNVAAATDFGQLEDGSHFLVLEYVSGKTLHQVIKQGPLPAARAVRIGRQLAAALQAAHAMGIVHRDVKPRNVMLVEGKGDLAKLIDFGLAKVPVDRVVENQSMRPPAASISDATRPRRPRLDSLQDSKPRLTGVGVVVGTVAYLAPEAALGMDAVDARSDLYALGLVLYQMLAGRGPFEGDTDAALFAHQRFTPPPPFAARAPGVVVPPALEAVVMKLLAKDPAERYPSGAAVIEALDAAMGGPAATGVTPPAPSPGMRAYLAVIVCGVAVGVGVGAALVFNRSSVGPRVAALPSAPPDVASAPGLPVPPAEAAAPSAASATVPAAASTPAPAPAPAETEASAAQRTLLLRALRVRDWKGGEAAFLDLVEHEPAAFRTPDMALAARDLAVAVEREGFGDRLFDALTNRLGTSGLDVLYDLVATKGRAGAALRAGEILRRAEVMERATPELRVAFALREAPCVEKLGLLDRAAAEGDGRALVVLQTQGVACFRKNNKAVLGAMAALRSRLHRGQ